MTPHQQLALAEHCRFAFETAQSHFRYLIASGSMSIVLTVNSGHE